MSSDAFDVLIYPQAEHDLKTSPVPLLENLQAHIVPLGESPFVHPLVNDSHLREKGYRHIPVNNFLVFYVVVDREVQIRRVLYGRRDYSRIL